MIDDAEICWLPELQALGYVDPIPIPAHVGIQAILATVEVNEIHSFIQEHDKLAMDG